jgi:hypothetical protein
LRIFRTFEGSSGRLPNVETWSIVFGARRALVLSGLRLLWAGDEGPPSVYRAEQPGSNEIYFALFGTLVAFEVNFSDLIVTSWPLKDVSQNTIEHLVVDQVWPRIIAHYGSLVLHAAGVLIDDSAVLLIGQSGFGKSTLAASFQQNGFQLLGDDAMVIVDDRGEQRCRAVYPSLRLFPDSITTLFDGTVRSSEVGTYTVKRNIHVAASTAENENFPVKAVFFLCPCGSDEMLVVKPVATSNACMKMIEHSFWLDPTNISLTIAKMTSASALAGSVAAYDLSYQRDYHQLPKIKEAMLSIL